MMDLVIKNGKIYDGNGGAPFTANISIKNGKIEYIGENLDEAKEIIDASNFIVTPGWVDIHTHYDAQVTWDPYLSPSSWHGVTTVVMGNCGVGFAPVKPEKHDWLIDLMEGVEDIPGSAMVEGIQWEWESFPEYIKSIENKKTAVDFAVLVPHGPVRYYVMGERGAKNESATEEDIKKMYEIVKEGLDSGALGFSTSRTMIHRSKSGELVPGTFADENELFGIGKALEGEKYKVFQMTSNHIDMDKEFPWMKKMAEKYACTVTFNLLQTDQAPDMWKKLLALASETEKEGLRVLAQIAGRPSGVLMTWEGTAHPFLSYPTYQKIAHLPFPERLEKLKDPEIRKQILSEEPLDMGDFANFITRGFHKMYKLENNPDYEPSDEMNFINLAKKAGKSCPEFAYDYLMENNGRAIIYFPIFNYSNKNVDHLIEMFEHSQAFLSLGDGGAHCGAICDSSIPTFMLTHWSKERTRGKKLPLEQVVKIQTKDTASVYGLFDRGEIKVGLKADLNIIDFDKLSLKTPEMVHDLPANGRRFIQKAEGYKYTIVSGEIIMKDGNYTNNLPGKLIKK
ncbi:MAG: amidohydrolase family protein [Candidatus Sericytochromatia bacterium]